MPGFLITFVYKIWVGTVKNKGVFIHNFIRSDFFIFNIKIRQSTKSMNNTCTDGHRLSRLGCSRYPAKISSHICDSYSSQHSDCVPLLAIIALHYHRQRYLNVVKTGWKPQEGELQRQNWHFFFLKWYGKSNDFMEHCFIFLCLLNVAIHINYIFKHTKLKKGMMNLNYKIVSML